MRKQGYNDPYKPLLNSIPTQFFTHQNDCKEYEQVGRQRQLLDEGRPVDLRMKKRLDEETSLGFSIMMRRVEKGFP